MPLITVTLKETVPPKPYTVTLYSYSWSPETTPMTTITYDHTSILLRAKCLNVPTYILYAGSPHAYINVLIKRIKVTYRLMVRKQEDVRLRAWENWRSQESRPHTWKDCSYQQLS
jgi:hypothetical protein